MQELGLEEVTNAVDDVSRVWGPETVVTTGDKPVLLESLDGSGEVGIGVIVGAVAGGVVVLVVLALLLCVCFRTFYMKNPE